VTALVTIVCTLLAPAGSFKDNRLQLRAQAAVGPRSRNLRRRFARSRRRCSSRWRLSGCGLSIGCFLATSEVSHVLAATGSAAQKMHGFHSGT
jgi:hypothetical protein